ncbi:hypothetical protein COLO4_00069 [Corchorus olitorius]|uniref:Uncharacterized protein n=1 Tax=Corchorus olitorius TaxID=93759 RepID=A0A1R3L4S1_9ROSI|nr:hypothetical protein COLO4_00069 [Corchorus olitorius]
MAKSALPHGLLRPIWTTPPRLALYMKLPNYPYKI